MTMFLRYLFYGFCYILLVLWVCGNLHQTWSFDGSCFCENLSFGGLNMICISDHLLGWSHCRSEQTTSHRYRFTTCVWVAPMFLRGCLNCIHITSTTTSSSQFFICNESFCYWTSITELVSLNILSILFLETSEGWIRMCLLLITVGFFQTCFVRALSWWFASVSAALQRLLWLYSSSQ